MASTPSSTDARAAVASVGIRVDLLRGLALALGYFVVAWLALRLVVVHDAVPVIAPATGLAMAALVLFGWRLVFGVVIGAVGAYLAAGMPVSAAIPLSLGSALTALAGAVLLKRAPDFRYTLARGRDVLIFICLAVICAPFVGTSIGVGALSAVDLLPSG